MDVSHFTCFFAWLISLYLFFSWRKDICKALKEWLQFFWERLSRRFEFIF